MWNYTGKVLEHFRNPRNVGVVEGADGTGEVGSLACGDALKLTFKLDKDGRIADAKFQTFGCASAIASSSALTEMIMGLTIDEAEQVTNQDIANYLGGLPDQKMHCSVMGREALEVAIHNYRTGETSKQILQGKVVCRCFGITEDELLQVIRDNALQTVEQVTNYSKAGGGCGGCCDDIQTLIDRVNAEKATPPKPKRMTILEKVRKIEQTIEDEIRPMLKQDSGDIELVDVDGNRVIVSLRGRCAQCSVSQLTLKEVVEAKLREYVAPDLEVVEEQP